MADAEVRIERNEWVMLERLLSSVPVPGVRTPSQFLEWCLDNELELPKPVMETHKWVLERLKVKCGFFVRIREGEQRRFVKRTRPLAPGTVARARMLTLNARIPS